MAAYDKLPPTARLALQNAAFKWAAQPILSRHRNGVRGYVTGPDILKTIAHRDAKKIAKDCSKIWGIDNDDRHGDRRAVKRKRVR